MSALPCYLSRPRFLRAVCFLSFYLTVTHGISPYSACISQIFATLTVDPLLYIGASLMSSAASEENMRRAFAFGRLAIRIIETHAVPPEVASPVYKIFASHILVWHRPLFETQKYFLAAITKGLE